MGFKGEQYIWRDRRRRMGLPLSFTRYALSEDRLFLSVGFFNLKDEDVLLYRVRDLSLKRSLWQRICGVGIVTLYCSDKSDGILELKNIKKHDQVRRFLSELVEQKRSETGIKGRELFGTGHAIPHPDVDGDGDCDA